MEDRIFSNVFNLPLVRTLSEYNSIGNNNKDRVLYDVLHEKEKKEKLESLFYPILCYDFEGIYRNRIHLCDG